MIFSVVRGWPLSKVIKLRNLTTLLCGSAPATRPMIESWHCSQSAKLARFALDYLSLGAEHARSASAYQKGALRGADAMSRPQDSECVSNVRVPAAERACQPRRESPLLELSLQSLYSRFVAHCALDGILRISSYFVLYVTIFPALSFAVSLPHARSRGHTPTWRPSHA